jgi:hypothetical protein
MTITCPNCGHDIPAAAILGAKGGFAGVGKAKARTRKQARNAARARWAKVKVVTELVK